MIRFHTDLIALLQWTHAFPRVRALSCGFLSAIFLILSFPFFDSNGLWWFALLTPLPLLSLTQTPVIRPSRAAFFAGLGTLPAWLWAHQWMWNVSEFGTPILMLYLMVYPALFVWIGSRVQKRWGRGWLTLPVVWIGIEYLKGHAAFTGYPWYLSMQPLIDSPGQILAAPAVFAGVSGMYFVGLISTLSSWMLLRVMLGDQIKRNLLGGGMLVVCWIGLGAFSLTLGNRSEPGDQVTVGIIQPNVPQDNRMSWTDRQRYVDWLMLRQLTEASSIDPLRPDLIIWPEGFVPGWTFDPISLEHERDYGFTWNLSPKSPSDAPGDFGLPERVPATTIVDQLLLMQSQLEVPMIVGSVAYENLDIQRTDENWVLYKNDGMYNSAFVVQSGQVEERWYNKMHLTPFGEVMPIISNWEWLEQQLLSLGATGMEFILSPGDEATVLEVHTETGTIRAGVPICFEATVPGVCRKLVFADGKRRADLLVNITNDGWFGDWDPSRRSHMLIARWRCIELATPMIRSANSGVSCVIDRKGGIVQEDLTRSDRNDPRSGYLNARVELGSSAPIPGSGLIGTLFGWGMLGMTLLGLVSTFSQKRSEPDQGADE